jgi:hypothetical protein
MTATLIGNNNEIVGSQLVAGGVSNWCEMINVGVAPTYDVNSSSVINQRLFKVPRERLNEFGGEAFQGGLRGRHPMIGYLFIDDVKVMPFADGMTKWYQTPEGVVEPEYWLCTVTYRPLVNDYETISSSPTPPSPLNSNGADLYDGSIHVTNEVLMIEGDGVKWENQPKRIAIMVQLPKIIPIIDRVIRIPNVARIPWESIRTNVGRVNDSFYMNSEPETLLYVGARVSFRRLFNGLMNYNIEHHFKERIVNIGTSKGGWNHFWDVATQTWRRTTPLIYRKGIFDDLIPGVS